MAGHRPAEHGQVLVIFAVLLTILLAAAGLSIDIGRQVAERRHVQTAADAAALAACRELIQGSADGIAADVAGHVAMINLSGSPSAATATIADPPTYADLNGDGTVGADEMTSGIIVSGTSVRVAIASTVDTVLARVVGVPTLETGARARCELQGGPAIPIVARRYANPPGPGGGFVDHVATAATSGNGQVDASNPRGYDVRMPAGEGVDAGPEFVLYGVDSKATNDSSFRGFIALDVRNFEAENSRVYYNGVTDGTNVNTLKDMQSAYLSRGYPGPAFPPVADPPNGDTQVGVIAGQSNAFVVGEFNKLYSVGDRLLLATYDGTVMEIPDFSITPPSKPVTLPATTTSPVDSESFTVRRNSAFNSTVTLRLLGDVAAEALGFPEYNIVPDPPVSPPDAGRMSEPVWSTNVFIPAKSGTSVSMNQIETNSITPGIYTVWLEGKSGNPYYKTRRHPIPVRIDGPDASGASGPARRDFTLTLGSGETNSTIGGTLSMPVYLKTANSGAGAWEGGAVSLSWDSGSFTNCSLAPASIGSASITFSPTSLTPSSSGNGASSTMTITTTGLAQGCYQFTIRAHGTNGAGQPVTHLEIARFTVATTASSGQYVDIIGFAVFEVTGTTPNSVSVRAVSPISADASDYALRRAQRARLVPWS